MGTFSTKLIRMTEKHQQVTQVDLRHPILRNNLSESPSLGLDHGGCALPEQLDNRLGLPPIALKEPGTTHLVLAILLRRNRKGRMIKDVVWKGFTQTNSKEIDPRLDDS